MDNFSFQYFFCFLILLTYVHTFLQSTFLTKSSCNDCYFTIIIKWTFEFLKEENSQMKADFEEVDFTTQELLMKVSELTRNLEDKDEELASYRESAMQANEELKNKMDFENDIPELDVAPKGNSLFSEVEDRRHIAEEKLKRAETKLEKYKVNGKSRKL